MKIDLQGVWSVPVFLPYLQPDLTDAAVADAEAALGVKLPRTYLDLLRIQNGGYLRRTMHARGNGAVSVIAGIGQRVPSITQHDWADVKAVMEEEGYDMPARIDELVPFCGDGHYHYCFDYRRVGRTGEPSVTFVDVETFDADEQLAPDFATFLGQLEVGQARPAYGIVTDAPAMEVAAALSDATGHSFVDVGDQAHGYRVFRAQLPGDASWAWLTANWTRRGFVRADDREYATLSQRMREEVLQYPEHPDCAWFLTSTAFANDVGAAMVTALKTLLTKRALSRSPDPQ